MNDARTALLAAPMIGLFAAVGFLLGGEAARP
jgi:hypothetical protein